MTYNKYLINKIEKMSKKYKLHVYAIINIPMF